MQLFPTQDPEAEASTYENSRKTGFKENWSNALGLAMTEDLPLTSPMIPSTTESQRNKKIYEYINDGSIPRNVSDFYYDDPDGLAGYAKNVLGLEDIPTLDEFNEQKQLEYKYGREMANDVFAKQSKLGMFGELAGRAHAMALDPLYASSFLTGYGTATTIGQAALRAGLIEAGIELAAQPSKMSWKEEIGADYGGAQALTEVAFAGLGAAGLAALGKGVSGAIAKRFTPKDLTVEQATEVLERLAKDNPELEPVINTLRQADPEENMAKVVEADEAIDIRMADQGAKVGADVKGDLEIKAPEFEAAEEKIFQERAGIKAKEEGVPRGTPKPEVDTRHPLVREADDLVVELDDTIKLMEECF